MFSDTLQWYCSNKCIGDCKLCVVSVWNGSERIKQVNMYHHAVLQKKFSGFLTCTFVYHGGLSRGLTASSVLMPDLSHKLWWMQII